MEEFLLYTPADRNYGLLKYCEINHVNLGQLWKRGLSLVPSRLLFLKFALSRRLGCLMILRLTMRYINVHKCRLNTN